MVQSPKPHFGYYFEKNMAKFAKLITEGTIFFSPRLALVSLELYNRKVIEEIKKAKPFLTYFLDQRC
jgi:hypothetical protein